MEDAQFLTIDLDVRSRRSLAPLAAAWPWAREPVVTEGGRKPRWLIMNPRRVANSAEAAAKELLEHISVLRGGARQAWNEAHRRVFDVGVQAGGPGRRFEEVRFTSETLERIGSAGAQVQITVYPAEREVPFVRPGLRRCFQRRSKRQ